MLSNFVTKTTVKYTITILVDGTATALDATDTVTLIFKEKLDDSDSDAVLTKVGEHQEETGTVLFTLTPSDTDLEGEYYYEIKWDADGDIYIIESSTVTISKRVFD